MGCFIFGFDQDGRDVFKETLQLVDDIKVDIPRYAIYTPYPNTAAFKKLEPTILKVTQSFSSFVDTIERLVINNPMLGETLSLIARIVAPALLVVAVFKAVAAFKALVATIKLLNLAIAANPVMAIVALIIFAVGLIIANWSILEPYFLSFWEGLKVVANKVVDWVVGGFNFSAAMDADRAACPRIQNRLGLFREPSLFRSLRRSRSQGHGGTIIGFV